MNPLTIVMFLMSNLPKLIDAVRTIMASDAAHTIETAIAELIGHVTPGGPASQALAPSAPTLVAPTVVDPGDTRQASTT